MDYVTKVRKALEEAGIETPMTGSTGGSGASTGELIDDMMRNFGLDMTDDSLCDTPKRVDKMYRNELWKGLDYDNFPSISLFANKEQSSDLVAVSDIKLHSMCEHHLLPILGKAHIAYIPNGKIIGLSKFNRIVDFFASRPQVQERLNAQIHKCLTTLLETEDVAVVTKAEHLCVIMRGVKDTTSITTVSKMTGKFMDNPALRQEFLSLVK